MLLLLTEVNNMIKLYNSMEDKVFKIKNNFNLNNNSSSNNNNSNSNSNNMEELEECYLLISSNNNYMEDKDTMCITNLMCKETRLSHLFIHSSNKQLIILNFMLVVQELSFIDILILLIIIYFSIYFH